MKLIHAYTSMWIEYFVVNKYTLHYTRIFIDIHEYIKVYIMSHK